MTITYRKSSIKPPGGAYFFQALLRGGRLIERGPLKERGGLFNLVKCINGSKVSRGRTCGSNRLLLVVTGRYTAFSNNKKIVTILPRELEHKVEKVQQMKLEVKRPKTKNNMNFQPEKTITDQATLIVCEE